MRRRVGAMNRPVAVSGGSRHPEGGKIATLAQMKLDQPPPMGGTRVRTVFFQCHLTEFHGSHLKLWNYFTHVLAAPEFTPRIAFSSRTIWNETNPWLHEKDYIVDDPYSLPVDVFFLGGRHWAFAEKHPNWGHQTPVVNLVQHVNHADPADDRYKYLSRPAIRICVAPEISEALQATGKVRGPLLVIPNGIDLDDVTAQPDEQCAVDILIAAVKRPDIGTELQKRLTRPGRRVRLLTERLPRADYLSHVRAATVTVFLPNDTEGFYLPVLEGFAADTLVVCPDCTGNRTFCLPGYNAFRPSFKLEELVESAEAALSLSPERAAQMRVNARATAEQYTLRREQEVFHGVLRDIDELWQEALAAARAEPVETATPRGGVQIERPERHHKRDKVRLEQRLVGHPPDYIIVGTQKGGTTSLHHYVTGHPQVGRGRGKEIHFFSWKYDKGLDWYLARFPSDGEAMVVGEASTSYLCHPEAPARVRRVLPDVKLIVLLRNPVDRAYSQYQMNVRKGYEALTFEDALAAEPQRLCSADSMSATLWRYSSYATRGLYAEQLEWWLDEFPREQLLVLQSETLFERPAECLREALAFLGLSTWEPVEYEVHNPGSYNDMRAETRARLVAQFAPHNRRLYDLLGRDFGWDDA